MRTVFILILSVVLLASCGNVEPKETHIQMLTDLGEVTLVLYDETPIHKENFIALTEAGAFHGMYFHRIVPGFIVQAGDPTTRSDGGKDIKVNYTLPAEITGNHIHTEGKLAAARQPDDKNPEWRSSGSQFYIVTGSQVYEEDLSEVEKRLNMRARSALYDEFLAYEQDPYNPIDFDMFLSYKNYEDKSYYTKQMRATYSRKRGAPNLDFQYTIFGEVLLGMDVIRPLDQVPVKGEQPLRQVRIRSMNVVDNDGK
jgi:cyclophilin family peptidyl-prolyl cis-trans isomerase